MYETLSVDKLEGVDYNYGNSFSKFQPKDPNRAFLVPRMFFLFWVKLCVFANSRVLIRNLILLDPSLKFPFFWMKRFMLTLHVKFEDADFKYDISLWNFGRKYPIKAVLVPNLRIFIFGWNFVLRKIWVCWCKISQHSSFFEFQPKNTQIRQSWSYI